MTFYVNGGGTKIKFNKYGRSYYDEEYNQRHLFEIDKIKTGIKNVLVDAAKKRFGLSASEAKQFQEKIKDKIPGYNFDHTCFESPKKWKPEWYTVKEVEGIEKAGTLIAYPWIEMRGWSCDSDGLHEKAASLAIRPLPDFIVKTTGENKEIRNLRAHVIKFLKKKLKKDEYYIGAAGRSTIDISCGKMAAIQNFMHWDPLSKERRDHIDDMLDDPDSFPEEFPKATTEEWEERRKQLKELLAEYVFYFGDEFYTWILAGKPSFDGNDQPIADQDKIPINTIAVNEKITVEGMLNGPAGNAIWIGRTPQALLEFLEEILLKPGH